MGENDTGTRSTGSLLPDYGLASLVPPPGQDGFYADVNVGMDTMNTTMAIPMESPPFSVETYAQVAAEMTSYITWDLSELPLLPDWEPPMQ